MDGIKLLGEFCWWYGDSNRPGISCTYLCESTMEKIHFKNWNWTDTLLAVPFFERYQFITKIQYKLTRNLKYQSTNLNFQIYKSAVESEILNIFHIFFYCQKWWIFLLVYIFYYIFFFSFPTAPTEPSWWWMERKVWIDKCVWNGSYILNLHFIFFLTKF